MQVNFAPAIFPQRSLYVLWDNAAAADKANWQQHVKQRVVEHLVLRQGHPCGREFLPFCGQMHTATLLTSEYLISYLCSFAEEAHKAA